ncbi:Lipin/Ned1/Smp2-domain-containing protein [Mycena maculata]|uniref:phosphatidate phosphatase n=1 Tax=Mycena maculata TaxID=230809 RepID=A0AAD7IXY6_9AGAR|nr:Lipin/Ned1/Smp2-domain-containing protein [Mycena maculata]
MNYIRGAVNAISAPYQYYRDLPPINPATLTGAIDVIVVQRPTSNGATELVCSPFHVRFGKWQVLRPGEKKVKVSVNGHAIPFDMKIGEAGEAFFVFETDDDVPADLITSPLLQPTKPDEGTGTDIPTDRFGARQDPDEPRDVVTPDGDPSAVPETPIDEPDFLDLNADPSSSTPPSTSSARPSNRKRPSALSISSSRTPSPPPSATPASLLSMSIEETQDQRVDRALKVVQASMEAHAVQYKPDIALDGDGYHARPMHDRDRTLTVDDDGTYRPRTPSPNTDNPPLNALPKLDMEYSWEWGAFPQPSPMKTSFGMGGRAEGGIGSGKDVAATWGRASRARTKRMGQLDLGEIMPEAEETADSPVTASGSGTGTRSRSVPPDLEGSPSRSRRRARDHGVAVDHYEDDVDEDVEPADAPVVADETVGYGAGGRLSASQSDPTKFTLAIEGKKAGFELSLVSDTAADDEDSEDTRGRRDRSGSSGGTRVFNRRGEVEAARLFGEGQIDLGRFIEDETVVRDPRLVIRWAGDQYITRSDGSPLMDALVLWRDALVKQTMQGIPLRPTSPMSDAEDAQSVPDTPTDSDEQQQRLVHNRSKSEPPEQVPKGKPTSSSWVQWWSRSKGNTDGPPQKDDRPPLPWTASAPTPSDQLPPKAKRASTEIPPADSAPTPSTPLQRPAPASSQPSPERKGKKFAKTLRLTSDQLKSLNLKPGPNSITFSLSTSGVIACTARIFVWDSTDLVLVSDIDGTITKSDGLGHVFAMIGRDWTHLGVAKLYTDITRNGYKIMYLTSRAIGQADATRDYLKGIKQNDYQLPEGPVIMSPDRLMASLHREVIMRKPEVFKMACLRDIQRLFGEASRNPFYAGFGNRITDALSYRSVNVPSSRIFTIDSSGEVKLELLELAGYKSSYIHMTDLVDQMFPPIHRKWTPEYTDFNYWKPPVQEFPLPDFSPPSPALSARSDTSNRSTLARLRNFSLVSGRQSSTMRQAALNQVNGNASKSRETSPPPDEVRRSAELQQMTSFERLSNTLSSSFGQSSSLSGRRSLSPESHSSSSNTYADSEDDDDDDDPLDLDGKRRRRQRRRSMTSMPGSLDDDMQFDMDDAEPGEYEDGKYSGDVQNGTEEEEEEAFDEDLLAAGEMKNVPFL